MNFTGEKKGFLNENFRMFYLNDKICRSFDYHFHDFYKIVIMVSGNVNYLIEGMSYKLKPWDILFVSNDEVHKPLVDCSVNYERFILWINPSYMNSLSSNNSRMSLCFENKERDTHNLLRLGGDLSIIQSIIYEIHDELRSDNFCKDQLIEAMFIKLMVLLNRQLLSHGKNPTNNAIDQNSDITSIIKYINDNLASDITIDSISSKFFMNRYYLMHKFKDCTGFTVKNYITQKRLIQACNMLRNNTKPCDVYLRCGFKDYSSFYRSFKKFFGVSPKKYKHTSILDK